MSFTELHILSLDNKCKHTPQIHSRIMRLKEGLLPSTFSHHKYLYFHKQCFIAFKEGFPMPSDWIIISIQFHNIFHRGERFGTASYSTKTLTLHMTMAQSPLAASPLLSASVPRRHSMAQVLRVLPATRETQLTFFLPDFSLAQSLELSSLNRTSISVVSVSLSFC